MSTKTEEKEIIKVSWSRFVEGIALTFSGVITMLEALDPKTVEIIKEMAGYTNGGFMPAEEKDETKGTAKAETPAVSGDADHSNADDVSVPDQGGVEKTEAVKAPAKTKSKAHTLSQDDITKIIVRKIKQDRSNNEKIGEVLKTYGVSKVSELPEDKYEAFITDISAI